jgi:predicted anti-sigma-YlaC factor YlaD
VNCDDAREALSAATDGEATLAERRALDDHLLGCGPCRTYASRLEVVDRMVRVRPAEPGPDLVGAVTAGGAARGITRVGWMRPALGWLAAVLLVQSLPALVAGQTSGADPHLARHLGAFGVALAVGFADAAWRPHRAAGLLPIVVALVATMVAGTVFDLVEGGRRPLQESVHLPEIIGLVLVWMIAGAPGWRGQHRHETAGSSSTA